MWDKPRLLNWIANFLYALFVVMVLYTVLFIVVHLPIFPLREVKVEGQLAHVNREQVKLIVAKHMRGNFFTLDLEHVRDAFEKLPWARNVSVRRRWPDTLSVVIEEHQALARWGNIALVNTHGELFHAASDAELPVFYGPGDGVLEVTKNYGEFSKILHGADISIAQVTLSPRRAWEIKTDGDMEIALGREVMNARLSRFVEAYKNSLTPISASIKYADLRYPNGFAVRRPIGSAVKENEVKVTPDKLAKPVIKKEQAPVRAEPPIKAEPVARKEQV